jgi:hypothetical protein
LLKLVSSWNQWNLAVKITSPKVQSRKLTMILQFYLQLEKVNFLISLVAGLNTAKFVSKTASYAIK